MGLCLFFLDRGDFKLLNLLPKILTTKAAPFFTSPSSIPFHTPSIFYSFSPHQFSLTVAEPLPILFLFLTHKLTLRAVMPNSFTALCADFRQPPPIPSDFSFSPQSLSRLCEPTSQSYCSIIPFFLLEK